MKVNLFIVGAPKCGTTALCDYINQHPEVFVPKIKEPHYFSKDFYNYRRVTKEETYSNIYNEGVRNGCNILCDASVWYLYSKVAAKEIRQYNKDAKIIIMIRDPVTMLPSLHNQLVYSGREDVNSFEEAWDLVEKRKKGLNIPKNSIEISHLYYDEVCKYYEQICRYNDLFPNKNVKIITFDDFMSNTKSVVKGVFEFLCVDEEFYPNLKQVNAAREHKYKRVAEFLQYPPFPLSYLKDKIKKTPFIMNAVPMRSIYKILSKKSEKKLIGPEYLSSISSVYEEDIKQLESMLDIDVREWKNE